MKILERTILVSKAQTEDGKFNILEYHTRQFINEMKDYDLSGKLNLFEIRFRAIPDEVIDMTETRSEK